jgi:hypothetical protein
MERSFLEAGVEGLKREPSGIEARVELKLIRPEEEGT